MNKKNSSPLWIFNVHGSVWVASENISCERVRDDLSAGRGRGSKLMFELPSWWDARVVLWVELGCWGLKIAWIPASIVKAVALPSGRGRFAWGGPPSMSVMSESSGDLRFSCGSACTCGIDPRVCKSCGRLMSCGSMSISSAIITGSMSGSGSSNMSVWFDSGSSLKAIKPPKDSVWSEWTSPKTSWLSAAIINGSGMQWSGPDSCSMSVLNIWETWLHSWMWWEPKVDNTKAPEVLGWDVATRRLRRSTKSCARPENTSTPLGCDRWSEFQPLWEPSIQLPSVEMSWHERAKHPFLTWLSWSLCT